MLICPAGIDWLRFQKMTLTTDAIYENGVLRPLSPLGLPEHARVKISVDVNDDERTEWLAQSERRLTAVWDNSGDDVFNDLLTP
jgi:predicted DNA-binding antitoxin AbrB/MazE fold protein